VDLADAFLRETGVALEERTFAGMKVLMPVDDRLGAFGILVGRKWSPDFAWPTRDYGNGVELVLYGKAKLEELDAVLRKITRGAA